MPTTLVVEAGGTKTEARLLKADQIVQTTKSVGINPIADPRYPEAIGELCMAYADIDSIQSIYYYGAGCMGQSTNELIANELISHLRVQGEIQIKDDLTGAARALCEGEPGIVGIIGTGSNIGYSDGHSIIDKTLSGGYLLGDEGSGYHIGREIIKRYIRKNFSDSDSAALFNVWKLSPVQMITEVYASAHPRRFIAGQASMIYHLSTYAQDDIIRAVIQPLIKDVLLPMYERYSAPIHLLGGVAYHFADTIDQMLKEHDIPSPRIARSAVDGLVKYHTKEAP